jgi:hypothetical protein
MRKVILIVLALLVVGCGATATPTAPAKTAHPWGGGDRAEYTIEVNGQPIGALVFTTAAKETGYVLTTETTIGAVKDVSNVKVDNDLKPVGATRQLSGAGQSDFTLMTIYDKGKLTIQAKTAAGDKAASIDVPADSWDNDQLLMSIRSLPLNDTYVYTFTNVIGANAGTVKTQLTVVGKETISVAAGSFTAYKVEMSFGQSKQFVWVDAAKPHHIIKYENTDTKQVISLTKVSTQ